MIKLDAGNVLLKPSHRRQLMAWLRRSMRLGAKLGNFVLQVTLLRVGRSYDIRANVSDSMGTFKCHSRRHEWRDAARELVRALSMRLHEQRLHRTA